MTKKASPSSKDGKPSGYAPDVFRAAVYFAGTSARNSETLERSLVFAGPANFCPVLARAIGGVQWEHQRHRPKQWPPSILGQEWKRLRMAWLPGERVS